MGRGEGERKGRRKAGAPTKEGVEEWDAVRSCFSICSFSPEVCGVPSESLVPGDVLVVPPTGMTVPCDAALLSGHAIVNEAMLTGAVL